MRTRGLLAVRFWFGSLAVVCVVALPAGAPSGRTTRSLWRACRRRFAGLTDEEAAKNFAASQGDQKWWEVYQDPAAAGADSNRGETELRCTYRGHADSGGAGSARDHASRSVSECFGRREFGGSAARAHAGHACRSKRDSGRVNVSAGWELDFWGKFRRATEAARANLVSTEWSQREVRLDTRGECGERVFSVAGARSISWRFRSAH